MNGNKQSDHPVVSNGGQRRVDAGHKLVEHFRSDRLFSGFRFRTRTFDSPQLNTLYRRYTHRLQHLPLVHVLTVLTVLSVILAVLPCADRNSIINLKSITLMAIAGLFLVMLIATLKFDDDPFCRRVVVWLCLLLLVAIVALTLPIHWFSFLPSDVHTGQPDKLSLTNGVWSVIVCSMIVYCLLPVPSIVCVVFGLVCAITQFLAAAFINDVERTNAVYQLLAIALVYIWLNVIGVFCHCVLNRAQRKAFLNTRNCIASGLDVETENEKMDRLLCSIVPRHMVSEIRVNLTKLQPLNQLTIPHFVRKIDNVSIIFVDFINFGQLVSQSTSRDLVHVLNELFGRFDQVAQHNHCARVKLLGDCYFATTNLSEQRKNHASCAVNLALDIVDVVNSFNSKCDLSLQPRIGVHSGSVMVTLMGTKQWQTDVWSNDVAMANALQMTAHAGRVHISGATGRLLEAEFELEPSNVIARGPYYQAPQIDTYFVVPRASRRKTEFGFLNGSLNQRYNNTSASPSVMHNLHAMKYQAVQPFTGFALGAADSGSIQKQQSYTSGANPWKRSTNLNRAASLNVETLTRTNQYLSDAIDTGHIDRDKWVQFNRFTLKFRDENMEKSYISSSDACCLPSLICTLAALLLFGGVHILVMPRAIASLVFYVVALCLHASVIMVLIWRRCNQFRCYISQTFYGQLLVTLLLLSSFILWSLVNTYACSSTGDTFWSQCSPPHFVLVSCLMCLATVALYIRLPSFVQLIAMVLIVLLYGLAILHLHQRIYIDFEQFIRSQSPLQLEFMLIVVAFMMLVYLYSRHCEWIQRLSHVWQTQATAQKLVVKGMQDRNGVLLSHMLPTHVITHFTGAVNRAQISNVEIYNQAYPLVAVLFTNVANFNQYYSQLDVNNDALECMRILNEIICEFDQLLDLDIFKSVEKIRTFGPNFIVAVGLKPESRIQDPAPALSTLAEFAFALQAKISAVNKRTYNAFTLKTGIHIGPVVAGVVGAHKPQYDIWGKTVSVAYRLQTSSLTDHVQVSEDVYLSLRGSPFLFQARGRVKLRKDLELNTYFLAGRRPQPLHRSNNGSSGGSQRSDKSRPPSNHSSNGSQGKRASPNVIPGFTEILEAKQKIQTSLASKQAEPVTDSEQEETQTQMKHQAQTSAFKPFDRNRPLPPAPLMTDSQTEFESDFDPKGENYPLLLEEHREIEQLQRILKNTLLPLGKNNEGTSNSDRPTQILDATGSLPRNSTNRHPVNIYPPESGEISSLQSLDLITSHDLTCDLLLNGQRPGISRSAMVKNGNVGVVSGRPPLPKQAQQPVRTTTIDGGDVTYDYSETSELNGPLHPPPPPAPSGPPLKGVDNGKAQGGMRKKLRKKFRRLIPEPATTSQSDLEFVDTSAHGFMQTRQIQQQQQQQNKNVQQGALDGQPIAPTSIEYSQSPVRRLPPQRRPVAKANHYPINQPASDIADQSITANRSTAYHDEFVIAISTDTQYSSSSEDEELIQQRNRNRKRHSKSKSHSNSNSGASTSNSNHRNANDRPPQSHHTPSPHIQFDVHRQCSQDETSAFVQNGQVISAERRRMHEAVQIVLSQYNHHLAFDSASDMPESDQAQFHDALEHQEMNEGSMNRHGKFPTNFNMPFFLETPVVLQQEREKQAQQRVQYRRSLGQLCSGTEYENADLETDFVFSDTESQLRGCSPDLMGGKRDPRDFMFRVAPWNMHNASVHSLSHKGIKDDSLIGLSPMIGRQRHPLVASMDYLGLDAGVEADIDSLMSSRASSRVFFDESAPQPFPQSVRRAARAYRWDAQVGSRRSLGASMAYDSEYENEFNAHPDQSHAFKLPEVSQISSMEIDMEYMDHGIDPMEDIRRITNDIQKSFGDYKLASFSDLNNSD